MIDKFHDASYKNLFSHSEMIQDLLLGFVPLAWVNELDFSSLDKVPNSYISEDLRERHDDIVWRVRWKTEWVYIYLLIEFQHKIDDLMALRVYTYTGLLYQDLAKHKKLVNGLLPPLLPLVLYNGKKSWDAPTDVNELVYPPPRGLSTYTPHLRYFILDEHHYADSKLEVQLKLKNFVAALFRLEKSRTKQEMLDVINALIEWLASPTKASLRRAFSAWIYRLVEKRFGKDEPSKSEPKSEIPDLPEVQTMLSETIDSWIEQAAQKARKEGMEKGYTEVLLKQLELKFGKLPNEVVEQVNQLTTDDVMLCLQRVLIAKRMEDVLPHIISTDSV